jgi:hypothetical protein
MSPESSREDKIVAAFELGLTVLFEVIEPDDLLPVGIPLDDLARHAVVGQAKEAMAKGVDEFVNYIYTNFPDHADAIITKIDEGLASAGQAGIRSCRNSFSADTLVATPKGLVPISELEIGDLVLAYNEATGEFGYYPITATISHTDQQVILLTLEGEVLITTDEHPFLLANGEWADAGDLKIGMEIRQADGTTGRVQGVRVVRDAQPMYNLTVDVAHTFVVGDDQWVVHNTCGDAARQTALRNFSRKDFYAGGEQFSITKERLDHILARHHPDYRDGSVRSLNTQLTGNLSVDDVVALIERTIQEGYSTRTLIGNGSYEYRVMIDGIIYRARTEMGKVVHFTPEP